jgi:cytochrome c
MLRPTVVNTIMLAHLCAAALPVGVLAQEAQATPEEIIAKVKEATDYLAETGEAGLEKFARKDSEFVWKDAYVVVNNCEEKRLTAHPIRPELAGASFADAPSFEGVTGEQVGAMLCEAGARADGGWVEYPFPKPGAQEPSRKLSYARAVEGTPYVLNAGIYSDEAKIEELETLITE